MTARSLFLFGDGVSILQKDPVSFDIGRLEQSGTADFTLSLGVTIGAVSTVEDVDVILHPDTRTFTSESFTTNDGSVVSAITGELNTVSGVIVENNRWLRIIWSEVGVGFATLGRDIVTLRTAVEAAITAAHNITNGKIAALATNVAALRTWQQGFDTKYNAGQSTLVSRLDQLDTAHGKLEGRVAALATAVTENATKVTQAFEKSNAKQAALLAKIEGLRTEVKRNAEDRLRSEIYRALTCDCCKPNVHFMLPKAYGGCLEVTIEVVANAIAMVDNAGYDVNKARKEFLQANELLAATNPDYAQVWNRLGKAAGKARIRRRGDDDDDKNKDDNHKKKHDD